MRRHLHLFTLFFIGNISFVTGQDCDCDHIITLEQKRVDGNAVAVNLEKLPQGSYLINLLHDGTRGRFIKILKK